MSQPPAFKRFSDFAERGPLDGEKRRIADILNTEILVTDFRTRETKYPGQSGKDCLTLQFALPGGVGDPEKKYVAFTGSNVLKEQLEQYREHLPFLATVRKIGKYFTLT